MSVRYEVGDKIRALAVGADAILLTPLEIEDVWVSPSGGTRITVRPESNYVVGYNSVDVWVDDEGIGVLDELTIIEPADPDYMPEIVDRKHSFILIQRADRETESDDYDFEREGSERHGHSL